ncbi:Regulator of rDNA transcription protein 15 [Senna tora]|uniref:Regulator of rDNA transcription protein 15 n=1 Tax=Senna tora TaxID=362788 RepID=A0A834SD81_9FABA|nr:Regulator of rDNA transcription protein 15 [Senna tora]KAF7800383.1 Regulator of rDNA transcription protein 15 [Senna tora]KAF7800430.1 Regulator of rDNA transcription protein 15 [Senna tora]KAF7800445.1 Regulator of rDNA transcription protein 15 [Senna tora]KAF7800501.1 Regulator of rDNA transcription protein 15 [Senna tora]
MHVVDRQGLHFDPAYAREILSRKKVYPCVIDFCTAPTVGDPRRRPSRIWPRPGRIALELLVGLPLIIGFILTRHMHVGFGRDHDALIYALHRPSGMSSLTGRDLTWDADIFCATGVFTLSKLNDRVTCGTRAPLTRNLGSARATAETYREVALGAKLVIYNRVPVCTLRCARFASAREKTCTSDRFDAWDLEQLFAFLVICNPSRQTKAYFWRTVFFCSSKGEGRIEATRAESQWIVAARPLCHLQYPVAYLSRLQRILPAARWEFLQGVPCGSSAARVGFPLSVPVLSRLFDARGRDPEGPVPSPSPGRHAATRSRRGSSSSSPPTADGGCSPWRPDAVMSTTGRGRHSVLRIFKGRRGRTGHHATCGALPAAGPYLRLSRFQGGQAVKQKRELFPRPPPTSPDSLTLPSAATSRFRNFNPIPFRNLHRRPLRPGSRPRFCSDRRALLLIRAWHLPRRPGIGRALQRHPFSGLVDSAVRHRNPASGSSRIASSAYQKWPTWSSRFRGAAQQSSRAVLPI